MCVLYFSPARPECGYLVAVSKTTERLSMQAGGGLFFYGMYNAAEYMGLSKPRRYCVCVMAPRPAAPERHVPLTHSGMDLRVYRKL